MALYKLVYKSSVHKDLKSIPKASRLRIFKRLEKLAKNPRPSDCKKLRGQDKYRIRQGDYRILYTIIDDELVIWIIEIGHRKDIYQINAND